MLSLFTYVVYYKFNMKLNSKTKKSARVLGDPDPGGRPRPGFWRISNHFNSETIDDFKAHKISGGTDHKFFLSFLFHSG